MVLFQGAGKYCCHYSHLLGIYVGIVETGRR